jgi:hypothetical protein
MTDQPSAFFQPDGDLFRPTDQARGPWDPNSLHGRVIAGLMARTIEKEYGDGAFLFSRLTVDLFRLPPMAPAKVSTSLVRDGNRIKVIDAIVTSEGTEIARARAVALRKGEQPPGQGWSPPNWQVPSPEEIEAPGQGWGGRIPMWDTRPITGRGFGGVEQKRTWIRENRQLVEGEELTPFLRAAVAADFTNPFANSGDAGLNFVNADITLYLHRNPVGEWLGFEVTNHQSDDGIAVGECGLYDVQGPIGRSIVCGVANPRRR